LLLPPIKSFSRNRHVSLLLEAREFLVVPDEEAAIAHLGANADRTAANPTTDVGAEFVLVRKRWRKSPIPIATDQTVASTG
jgi:hypothetical protein